MARKKNKKNTLVRVSLPLTQGAKTAIKLADRKARRIKNKCIEPIYLLLGILLEGENLAAFVLKEKGVTVEDIETFCI